VPANATSDQPTRAARLTDYATASTRLSLLSDHQLTALLAEATPLGTGIGGAASTLQIDGVRVFVKAVPLTQRERRPENVMSTANHFQLPGFYQYGIGSSGFGAWRELAAHTMTTNWVLANDHHSFPLMYHWRTLPAPPASPALFAEFGGLDGAVAHWEDSPAVRRRLEALRDAPAGIVLFLEYIPQRLSTWLADQDDPDFEWVAEQLAETTAFMADHAMVHFDAHFHNLLTDGHRVYFSDFGLALSSHFDLSAQEQRFLEQHYNYDHAYTAAHLINHHVIPRAQENTDRRDFLRNWANGTRAQNIPDTAASVLTKYAQIALAMDDFHQRLCEHTKRAPYPAAQIERLAHPHSAKRSGQIAIKPSRPRTGP
jgi:hypothetical protein